MRKIINFILKNMIGFTLGVSLSVILAVYAATQIPSAQVKYNDTTVDAALNDLYKKAESAGSYTPTGCTTPTFNLGDYITIVPDSKSYNIPTSMTGYPSAKTINPSELTLWRVINKTPCNVEVVSEYTASTDVYFKGTTGYANFVGGLNEIARQYTNKYTSSARMMGYDGQTEYITDTSALNGSTNTAPGTTTTPGPTSGTGEEYSGGVLGDTLYLKDYQLVNNVYGNVIAYDVSATSTARAYWIASRKFTYSSSYGFNFIGRIISTSGSLSNSGFLRGYYTSWGDNYYYYRVRPILTLKSGLTVSGGSGTKASPYTLS